jgi:hypothetical protein
MKGKIVNSSTYSAYFLCRKSGLWRRWNLSMSTIIQTYILFPMNSPSVRTYRCVPSHNILFFLKTSSNASWEVSQYRYERKTDQNSRRFFSLNVRHMQFMYHWLNPHSELRGYESLVRIQMRKMGTADFFCIF